VSAPTPIVKAIAKALGKHDLARDEMAEVVPRRIAAVPGIARTHTLLTFQHYVSG